MAWLGAGASTVRHCRPSKTFRRLRRRKKLEPSSPAQTPIESAVENHARERRAAARNILLARAKRILRFVVPIAVLAVLGDCAWGNFFIFNLRAYQSEAKGNLKCYSAAPCDWESCAKKTCWNGIKKRYRYWQDPSTQALVARGEMVSVRGDIWLAAPHGDAINCHRGFVTPSIFGDRRPPDDPRCDLGVLRRADDAFQKPDQ